MAAGSIVVDLLMRTGSFETDTKRAEKALQNLKKEAIDAGKNIGIGLLAAGAGAAVFLKSAIDVADAVDDMSSKLGVSTEALSELGYAAQLSGSSQDELGVALTKLSSKIADVQAGNQEAVKLFNQLGLTVTDASGRLKSADVVFKELADRFAAMPDGVEKTALAVDLFGKSGANLVPLLSAGAGGLREMADEARALGVVISGETGAAAAQFNDNLDRLKAFATGAGIAIANELIPYVNRLAEEFIIGIKNANGLIDAILTFGSINPFKTGSENLKSYREQLQGLEADKKRYLAAGSDTRAIDEAIANAQKKINYLAEIERKALLANVKFSPDDQSSAEARRLGILPPARPMAGPQPPKPRPAGAGSNPFDQYLKSLQRQIDATRELNAAQQLQLAFERGELGKITPIQLEKLRLLANEIDLNKKLKEEQRQRIDAGREAAILELENLTRANEEFSNFVDNAIAATPTGRLEEQRRGVEKLTQAYELGRFGIVGSEEAVKKYGETVNTFLGNTQSELEKTKDIGEELGLTFTSAFEDAISGGKKLSEVISALEQDIIKLVTRELVTKPFASAITGIAKSIIPGGGIGDIFGSIGPSIKGFFGGAFAGGGGVFADRPILVGENGPEMFMPRTAGTIVPNMGSQTTNNQRMINVNVTAQPNMSRDTALQQGARIAQAIQGALGRNG